MDTRDLARLIAAEMHLSADQVDRTIALFDAGNTIPFVARYRKEVTGNLDEEQLRTIVDRLTYLRHFDERRTTILTSLAEQDVLTDELRAAVEAAATLQALEDLYLPYRPKRRTRAMIARERGLQGLADLMAGDERRGTVEGHAAAYVNDDVPTVEDALAGARDILAEAVSEEAETRAYLRERLTRQGAISSKLARGAEDPAGKYRDYHEYREPLSTLRPHRTLALNRGEREKILSVEVAGDEAALLAWLTARHLRHPQSVFSAHVRQAIEDGYRRLLYPAIEREVRAAYTEAAEAHAIQVFATNLRHLLLQPPLRRVRVLGLDPGFRTGCKAAAVDETGRVLGYITIYPHAPQNRWDDAKRALLQAIERYGIHILAIGNGTASRESESLAAEVIAAGAPVAYVMVSEAGASVYSASRLAGQELPDLDVSIRGAVSIARRLQDPLAEQVKIEPRSIGVGLYQHDVDQKELTRNLGAVVESVVNYVGVDVNTASPALLQYVAGLNARVAEAVVAHRDAHGPFLTRDGLLQVKGLGPRAFEQAAGFLRIRGGANPLDDTAIHPESYEVCRRLLARLGLDAGAADLPARFQAAWAARLATEDPPTIAAALNVGLPTLQDIADSLARPGRDPRDDLPAPILRHDVLKIEDLQPGMMLKGTVRNVVDFGAFVDIGVKQDGLVHVSELADRRVRNPLEVVAVGDIVDVRVLSVDLERGRVALSMRTAPAR